ncbi:hypothetical protein [Pyrococcus yayanosii]|uniref:Uncharacterized protein n=1 Tax=Pyrococcus yayanosii (strain CH1 / JCM 16557) TaxID=529709 RepID=F8AH20_PYRYC|nr:hypothetical protein [Pyrococcus yayanosii]AEH24078.1 hypothetical protein PYCH_03870 [Pyrococcus yayanosii CH1]
MYYDHFPTFGGYIFGMILYFALIPLVFLVVLRAEWDYIGKKMWKKVMRPFIICLLLASSLTSLLQFKLTNDYLYVYSLTRTDTCLTASCLVSEMERNEYYKFNVTAIQKLGMPRFGLMRAFRLVDKKFNKMKFGYEQVNAVVITRSMFPLPITEVWSYEVDPKDSHKITGLKKFYVYYPYNPGTLLSRFYDFEFTMFLWDIGGAPG